MSGEGKKKRGEAGKSNAQNIAFRNGGSKCDYSTKIGHTTHPRLGGSRFLSAMIVGAMLPSFSPSERSVKAADECMDSCPVVSNLAIEGRTEVSRGEKVQKDRRPIIRLSAYAHDILVGSERIDLSKTLAFGDRYGSLKPTKDMKPASEIIVASLRDAGMFESQEA